MPWTVIGIAAVGMATVVVTWLTARRSHSGKIATTEASTLWETVMGELSAYREEARVLRAEVVELRNETVRLNEVIIALRVELGARPIRRAAVTKKARAR